MSGDRKFRLRFGPRSEYGRQAPTGSPTAGVHFDTYDHTVRGKDGAQVKYVFAPFSHDAEVPEPTAALLLLAAGVTGGLAARRRG